MNKYDIGQEVGYFKGRDSFNTRSKIINIEYQKTLFGLQAYYKLENGDRIVEDGIQYVVDKEAEKQENMECILQIINENLADYNKQLKNKLTTRQLDDICIVSQNNKDLFYVKLTTKWANEFIDKMRKSVENKELTI